MVPARPTCLEPADCIHNMLLNRDREKEKRRKRV